MHILDRVHSHFKCSQNRHFSVFFWMRLVGSPARARFPASVGAEPPSCADRSVLVGDIVVRRRHSTRGLSRGACARVCQWGRILTEIVTRDRSDTG